MQGWASLGVPLPQHLSEAGQRVRKAVESVTSVTSSSVTSSVTSSSVTSNSVTSSSAGAELTASVYSPHLALDVASLWAEARLQAAAARLSQVGGVEEEGIVTRLYRLTNECTAPSWATLAPTS